MIFTELIQKNGKRIAYISLLLPFLWLLSGFYSVDQNEQSIEVIFGKASSPKGPGFHYALPVPLGKIFIVDIKKPQNITIGYENLTYDGMSNKELNGRIIKYTGNSRETVFVDQNIFDQQFMTGDNNIVSVEMSVSFNVIDPHKWFFKYENPRQVIASIAEEVLFNVLAENKIEILLVRDQKIKSELKSRLDEQLDEIDCGILLSSVLLKNVNLPQNSVEIAFRDVKSAEDDRKKRVEEAKREATTILTMSKTEVMKIHDRATVRVIEIKNQALTDSEIFNKMLRSRAIEESYEYRLYVDSMRELLGSSHKYLVDNSASLDKIFIKIKGE